MILVIPQLLFPIMASFVINKLINNQEETDWKKFKIAAIATAVVFGLIGFFYTTSDFSKENKERTFAFDNILKSNSPNMQAQMQNLDQKFKPSIDNQIYEAMVSNIGRDASAGDPTKAARAFVSALHKERASFLFDDIIRSLILVALAMALIALFIKKKINAMIMIVGITILSTADLLQFGMNYLNDKSFEAKADAEANSFPLTQADQQILADKDPNYRVFNTSSMEEAKTSYYHKSIGGYHPAKLGIYDDLIAYQFKGNINMSVVNMLNAKYFIQQQENGKIAQQNPGALGNVWFVKGVQYVQGPANEMRALDNFNPKDTAIVDESFKNTVGNFSAPDSIATIKQTSFDNDAITYESNSSTNNIAVFSEIFYKDWFAYVDGKKTPYFKTNYVLRGINVPAGKHKIEFKFEPAVYFLGSKINAIASWLVLIILLAAVALEFKKKDEVV
jgi:hypothetical protein